MVKSGPLKKTMVLNSTFLLLNAAAVAVASNGGVFDISLSEIYDHNPAQGNQYIDEAYIFEATIGTPPQKFTVRL